MTIKEQLQIALQKRYDRILFAKDVLSPVFNSNFTLYSEPINSNTELTQTENSVLESVSEYGKINLSNNSEIICYEIKLQKKVRIEQSKVIIQNYVRKLLTSGTAALVNFVSPNNPDLWRLTLVAKSSEITEEGVKEKTTHAKRYTYLLGTSETCRTAAERFEFLSFEKDKNLDALIKAFSVEKLSDEFFREYKEHYNKFVDNLEKSTFKISVFAGDSKGIRDFTKRLLGRIVFLYFVQKKGWLGATNKNYSDGDIDFIFNLYNESESGNNFYNMWLSKLFFETLNEKREDDNFEMPKGEIVKIPYLNGGLFEKEEFDDSFLSFDSKLFHNSHNTEDSKVRGFLDFLNSYNFTIYEDSPDDHTVAVDPEMLGHIFENLLEDNKDKGAFYTPKEIVHYMCQESLIEYLATNLSEEFKVYKQLGNEQLQMFGNDSEIGQLKLLEEFGDLALNHSDIELIVKQKDINKLTNNQLFQIDKLLDKVKICDPAIGSGAFPMGLLQEIYFIKELIAVRLNRIWNPAKIKEGIIQNSIYGVDKDGGAVDIARLRFWLSILIDEDLPKPLPNLDYKIVVGDSLIGMFENEYIDLEWDIDLKENIFWQEYRNRTIDLLTKIGQKQKEYFLSEGRFKKMLFEQVRNLKIDLLINQVELNIKKSENIHSKAELKKSNLLLTKIFAKKIVSRLLYLKEHTEISFIHFDWVLDFPEILNKYVVENNPGFDIVIGNPPYIQIQKLGDYSDVLEKANYKTFAKTGDLYCLFYEKGNKLLKSRGILCFITSNKWMNSAYGKNFRRYLLNNTNPILLIDFSKAVIFPAAVVFVNILIFKNEPNKNSLTGVRAQEDFQILKTPIHFYVNENKVELSDLTQDNWTVAEKQDFEITKVIDEFGTPLKKWDVQFYAGIKTAMNPAFHIDEQTKNDLIKQDKNSTNIIKPLLRGKDIKRWAYSYQNLYLINTHNGVKSKDIPRIDVEKDYPAIYKHLLQYYDKRSPKAIKNPNGTFQTLKDREDQGDHWTNLRNCAFIEEFEKEKIVWIEISDRANYCLDTSKHYLTNSAYFLTGKNLKYLLAVLNSRLMDFYFYQKTAQIAGGRKRYTKQYVELLPIPQLKDKELLNKFETIVTYIIFLNDVTNSQVNPFTDNIHISSVFEDTLNMMVYELYFERHMKEQEIDVLRFIDIFEDISNFNEDTVKQVDIIGKAYKWLQGQENPIRNRIILSNIRSTNIIRRVNSTTH